MRRIICNIALFSMALTICLGASSTTSAAESGQIVHRGILDLENLSWAKTAAGESVPVWSGAALVQQVGAPQLPGLSQTLLIPADISVGMIEIIPLKTRIVRAPAAIAGGLAMESSEGISTSQVIMPVDGDIWPGAWSDGGGASFYKGYRLLSYTLFPVRAVRSDQGTWDEIEVLEQYEVRILPSPNSADDDHARRVRLVPGERESISGLLERLVINPAAVTGYAREDGEEHAEFTSGFTPSKTPSLGGSPVSYLIITSDAMAAEFQTLADHRTATGLPAVVRTVEWIESNYRNGADIQETIRGFIREAYERWGVQYVLLGADTADIPARYAYSTFYPPGGHTEIPADIYYACIDGNWNEDGDDRYGEPGVSPTNLVDNCDMAAEVVLGRAPVNTPAEAANFVTKVVNYEKAPAGAAWTNGTSLLSEVLFWTEGGDVSLDGSIFSESLYNDLFIPYTSMTVSRLYENWDAVDEFSAPLYPGAVPLNRQAAIDTMNSGNYGIVDQIGHGFFFNMSLGDANFTVSDADNLNNGADRPFLLYALNCASAAFDYSCLMERFVQNDHGGSVASIGASRAAFPYTSNDFQYEFFRLLLEDDVTRLGDLMDLSRLPWLALAYSNSFTRWTYFNYTMLGDPGLRMWTGSPTALDLAMPASMGSGEQSFAVTAASGGSPVAGVEVTVSSTDLYAMGVTDGAGMVTLPLTISDSAALVVTANGLNVEWTSETVPVVLGSTYLALSQMTVTDDGTLGSSGNGNGVMEAGETVALRATFTDNGGSGTGASTVTLANSNFGVTIVSGSSPLPVVSPGGQAQTSSPFLVDLDATIADGTALDFGLSVTNGGPVWTSDWATEAAAPEVEAVAMDWFDTFYGDSDGVLDSGEREVVLLTLKNYGAGRADQLTGYLRSNSPNVILQDTVVTYAALDLLETTNGTGLFSLTVVDAGLPYSAWVLFRDNYGREFRHDFQLGVPAAPAGLVANSALGPDIIALSWSPVVGGANWGYNVYRSMSSGGPFTRVNADLVTMTSYFRDAGLDALTRYYYKVASVDTSLVESVVSTFISQSTAPPELTNFPLPFETETSGHCAVGDVTGDGHLEIVLGADEIYVWRDDGSELFDGDGDAQTLGPITNVNGTFGPAGITLADLDGLPGLEIIAMEKNSMQIYVFRSDGTLLPGWPQSLHWMWAWTTPAVGDIDGDQDLEIVINNLAGETLAWHHDGTEVADGDGNAATNGVLIVRPEGRWSWELSSPALFDLDGDGAAEIIFGTKYAWNNINKLHAFKPNGSEAPGFPREVGLGANILSSPSVADLDVDGIWEIIFVCENDTLYVLEQDGSNYPGFPIHFVATASGAGCPSPALGDFDGDGELEIAAISVVGSLDSYAYVIDTDKSGGSGTVLPGWPRHMPGNSESSPVVGDVNGDGFPDILFGIGGGSEDTPNNLYAFTHDGNDVDGFPITLSGPIRPAPVICDLDGDMDVDIIYGGWDLLVHVWDMPFAVDGTTMTWTTFRNNVHRDGVYRVISLTGVPEETPGPQVLTVKSISPNPFNPSTTVSLFLPGLAGTTDHLRVEVFDVLGRRVRTLYDDQAAPGWQSFVWHGRDDRGRQQPSGVYLLRARGGDRSVSAKMMLVK